MAKLYFNYSAMNAGKSTTLLQSAHNYEERGMRVMLFTPRIDDRAGCGIISSRIGLQRKATVFGPTDDLYASVRREHQDQPVSCVLVDEAQFLQPAQVLQLTLVCDRLHIPVLCYGIRTDFRGEPFPGSKYLLAWAEELVEIKTVCRSGRKATMNARLDASGQQVFEGEQIDIGHHYIALSRQEFNLPAATPINYQPPPQPEDEAAIGQPETPDPAQSRPKTSSSGPMG
jgi:thymidine kinase